MRYVFGEYVLDTDCDELRRQGMRLALAPQAFKLLTYLLEHRDRTVTKEELFEQVWKGVAVADAALTTCIFAVRQALEDRQHQIVQAVHRRGYRFVAPVDVQQQMETDTRGSTPPGFVPAIELHLPVTGAHLVGRAPELAQLRRLWDEGQANVCSLVAWGGVGKSALINHWIGQLARDSWRGATRVFGWTFYSQGMRQSVTSADGFVQAALGFFGDPDPHMGTPWDKGQRLARCVQAQRCLILLDGLEPLQHPPGPEAGKLKEPTLILFLKAIALHNPGLCVITTRLAVADLAAWHATTAPVLTLDALSQEAGAELLRALGVHGSEAEQRAASQAYAGHALAINLLGTYLRDVCGGDVRRWRDIPLLDDWAESGSPAWRIMASYERWLEQGPEVAVLRLLGLFDRAATGEEVAALRAAPTIPGLNESLIDLSARQWVHVLRRLRTAGLLAPPDPKAPHALDAHPLVREYYRHQLREQDSVAWRAGHERLFTHLQASVVEAWPATLEGLAPLYAAVAHGCLTGRAQDALRVFQHRIRRGEQQFSLEQLGAFGADVAALAHFFVVPWCTVMPGLAADDELFVLQAAGACLSALGRVDEAVTPLQQALALAQQQANWTVAAMVATKLSEVYRARGELTAALNLAQASAAYGHYPGVPTPMQVLSHAFLGIAQHWTGQWEAAKATFELAEQLQQQAHPERPILHAIPGYMYGELLLDDLEHQAASLTPVQFAEAWGALRSRIEQTLAFAIHDGLPCDIGLQHVAMARVLLLAEAYPGADAGAVGPSLHVQTQAQQSLASPVADGSVLPHAQALRHCTWALAYLRQSNHQNYVPRGLLTRAALYRWQHHFDLAHQDVHEALDLAQSSAMHFYQADAYLERAAIHLAAYRVCAHEEEWHQAAKSLAQAKALMDKMGYYRRTHRVAALEALLWAEDTSQRGAPAAPLAG